MRGVYIVSRASLRFEKDNIDTFRGFIETFSLFSNRSEAQIVRGIPHQLIYNRA